jgi:hypothetical protein
MMEPPPPWSCLFDNASTAMMESTQLDKQVGLHGVLASLLVNHFFFTPVPMCVIAGAVSMYTNLEIAPLEYHSSWFNG